MDLFFHCQRDKTHVFVDVSETSTVESVSKYLKQLLRLPTQPRLKMIKDSQWTTLEVSNKWSELGVTKDTAKAETPVKIAFQYPDDAEAVNLAPLANPTPLQEINMPLPAAQL